MNILPLLIIESILHLRSLRKKNYKTSCIKQEQDSSGFVMFQTTILISEHERPQMYD